MANSGKSEPIAFTGWRQAVDGGILAGMEGLVLAVVFMSPWAFGAVDPIWEVWNFLNIALLLMLWAFRILLRWRINWTNCSVAYCLAGFVLLALGQLVPLPAGVLAVVSPGTAQLYDRLLPVEPEQFLDPDPTAHAAAGRTISVYPHGTRRELVRLLAVLLLYLAVRNNLVERIHFWHLSWGGLITGTALALFSLVQFFTSRPSLIYWSIPAEGGIAFGPFISRNHFPFYLNLCFGLGLGLLCSRLSGPDAPKHGGGMPRKSASGFSAVFDLLHQPQVLWIGFFLMLMATSIVFSVSRGGLLAFLGAGMFCLTLLFKRSARFVHLEIGLLIVIGSLALLTWFGLERVQTRLGTLFQDQVWKDGRVSLLSRAPPLIEQFPLWGSGFGTLDYVEPMHRPDSTDAGRIYEHAHNEYLESLLEGGVVGLGLLLLTAGLVLRLGLRAFRRLEGTPAQGLVLGALFGVVALALHSLVDFGIHIPAIAFLATVLCAHLSASSEAAPTPDSAGAAPDHAAAFALSSALPALLGATALVCVGWFVATEGLRGANVRRLQLAAAKKTAGAPADQKKRLELLEAALRLEPANALLHLEVAQGHAVIYDAIERKYLDREALLDGIQALALLHPGCAPAAGGTGAYAFLFTAAVHQEGRRRLLLDPDRQHLLPALRHSLLARDLCPALARTHLEIAAFAEGLQKADARRAYLDRTLFLDPMNPEFWYQAGILETRDLHPDQAARDWRRCLELSDAYLKNILERAAPHFSPQELLDHLLPDNPSILFAAAAQLFPAADAPQRLPFLAKARRFYETLSGPLQAEDLRQRALVLAGLNQPKEAVASYREALAQKPLQVDWRLDLARLLFEQDQFPEALHELRTILAVQPSNGEAQELLRRTEREIGNIRGK